MALAVFTPQRSPVLPDVPTMGEVLSEFKQPDTSNGLLAPAGTPRRILDRINKAVARILEQPDVRERLTSLGYHPEPTTPAEYDKLLRSQIETLSRVVKDAGLRGK